MDTISRRSFLIGATALAATAALPVVGCSGSASESGSTSGSSETVVYKHGNIYTANANRDYATAMVVQDGRFVYVGDDAGTHEYEEGATVVDLDGATIIPGLFEGHTHFSFMAAMNSLGYKEIPEGIVTVDESVAQLKKFVEKHPDYDQYIIGNFSQSLDLDATQLDEVCKDKPVACVGKGLHCLYVNSKFMEDGGINKDSKDIIPDQTYYVRDKKGNPTGKIVELPQSWNAFQLAIRPDNEKVKEEYVKLQRLYHSYGFVGIADGGFLGLDEENMLKNITELEADGQLSMLVNTSSIWYGKNVSDISEIQERATSNKANYTTDLVRPGTVKMWADGTIGAYSALLREPYVDKDTYGVPLSATEDLETCAKMCNENDLNIHYHAIGDKAIENVLSVYEKIGETSGTKSIVHFQLATTDIIERAAKIDGLIVNMTPTWGTILVAEEVEPLGDRRNAYGLFKETMDAGLTVNFGADSNGDPSFWNPSLIMTTAMIRDPKRENVILKGKPCSFEEAVDAFSINVCKERRIDDEFGSIEVGKFANFVDWDLESMEVAVDCGEIGMMIAAANKYALKVYFKGDLIYEAPEL